MKGRGHGTGGGSSSPEPDTVMANIIMVVTVLSLLAVSYFAGIVIGQQRMCRTLLLATSEAKVSEWCSVYVVLP